MFPLKLPQRKDSKSSPPLRHSFSDLPQSSPVVWLPPPPGEALTPLSLPCHVVSLSLLFSDVFFSSSLFAASSVCGVDSFGDSVSGVLCRG